MSNALWSPPKMSLRWALITASRPLDDTMRSYNSRPDRRAYRGTTSTEGTQYEGRERLLGNYFADKGERLGFGSGSLKAKISPAGISAAVGTSTRVCNTNS